MINNGRCHFTPDIKPVNLLYFRRCQEENMKPVDACSAMRILQTCKHTLDGSLEECFAGLAWCHAIVVTRGHISTNQTQPLGQRAQRVLASPCTVSSGALLRTVAALVFEVAAQSWRVEWRGVTFSAVSSGSSASALRGVWGGSSRAGPTSPASFWTARFGLYVDVWPTLPGRHDFYGGKERSKWVKADDISPHGFVFLPPSCFLIEQKTEPDFCWIGTGQITNMSTGI